MKTAEEYLKENGLKNPSIDSGISGGGSAPRIRVSDIMKKYAKEVAVQTQIKCAENAKLDWKYFQFEDASPFIDKQSILNESNIPEL